MCFSLKIVVEFIEANIEVCPKDNEFNIREWGQPQQVDISKAIAQSVTTGYIHITLRIRVYQEFGEPTGEVAQPQYELGIQGYRVYYGEARP